LQYGFTAIGVIAWGYSATVWTSARIYQEHNSRLFDQELKLKNRAAIPRVAAVPKAGGLVGRLEIPRIGVSVMVVEGAERHDLERAVGHVPGTALPGQLGNVAIAGHRDTYFRSLAAIRLGDTISVSTLTGSYRYRVTATSIVSPGDAAVLYPTGRDTLTLLSCYPFYYVGAAPRRFIVRGVQVPPEDLVRQNISASRFHRQ